MAGIGGRPAPELAGARLGRVTGGTSTAPLVEVDGMVKGQSYGPARVVEGLAVRTTAGANAGDHGSHAHQYGAALAVGDEVLVLFLGSSRTELVVVDRLLPRG